MAKDTVVREIFGDKTVSELKVLQRQINIEISIRKIKERFDLDFSKEVSEDRLDLIERCTALLESILYCDK